MSGFALHRLVPAVLCLLLAGCPLAEWIGINKEVTLLQLEQRYETALIQKSEGFEQVAGRKIALGATENVYTPSTMAAIAEEAGRLAVDAANWRTVARAWHLSARAWIGAGEFGEVNTKAAADKVTEACARAESERARGNAVCQTAPILPHVASMNEQARGIKGILVAVTEQRRSQPGRADARFVAETRRYTDVLIETDYPAIRRLGEAAFAKTGNAGVRTIALRNLHRITCNVDVARSFLGIVADGGGLEAELFNWAEARRSELAEAREELNRKFAETLTFDPC